MLLVSDKQMGFPFLAKYDECMLFICRLLTWNTKWESILSVSIYNFLLHQKVRLREQMNFFGMTYNIFEEICKFINEKGNSISVAHCLIFWYELSLEIFLYWGFVIKLFSRCLMLAISWRCALVS